MTTTGDGRWPTADEAAGWDPDAPRRPADPPEQARPVNGHHGPNGHSADLNGHSRAYPLPQASNGHGPAVPLDIPPAPPRRRGRHAAPDPEDDGPAAPPPRYAAPPPEPPQGLNGHSRYRDPLEDTT